MTYAQFSLSSKVLVVLLFLENFSQNFFCMPQKLQGPWRTAGKTKRKTPGLHALRACGLMGGGGAKMFLGGLCHRVEWKGHGSRLVPGETLRLLVQQSPRLTQHLSPSSLALRQPWEAGRPEEERKAFEVSVIFKVTESVRSMNQHSKVFRRCYLLA